MSYGQQGPATPANEYNAMAFMIQQAMLRMQTVTLVKVMAVHGAGVVPVGTVDVQPLVNQMTGNRQAVPHATVYGIPFFRLQGGASAIVCDPHVGDIGLCGFASRDISAVKATRAAANPGSFRTFDYADGLYIGGFLNIAPTQYLQFDDTTGVTLVSSVKVKIQAPVIELDGTTSLTINTPALSFAPTAGSVTIGAAGASVTIAGKSFLSHEHTGVATGGGITGGVL
jgi:hypothetical protein